MASRGKPPRGAPNPLAAGPPRTEGSGMAGATRRPAGALRPGELGGPRGGCNEDYSQFWNYRPRVGDQRQRASLGQIHVHDQEPGSALAEEFERVAGSFCLPIDPEVMKPEEPSQQQPSFLIASDHHDGRCSRGFASAQIPAPGARPGFSSWQRTGGVGRRSTSIYAGRTLSPRSVIDRARPASLRRDEELLMPDKIA